MDIFESEEKYLYIHNLNEEKKCEFEVDLSDTLNLVDYECALFDLNLPNNLKTQKFFVERYIYFNLVWERDLDYDNYVSHTDPKFFDLETSPEQDPMKIDFKIGPNINTLDELRNAISEKTSSASIKDLIETFYKKRFANAILVDNVNLFYPEIKFENGYFRNVTGEIRFRGYSKTRLPSKRGKPPEEDNLEQLYETENNIFFKTKAAYLFFTFDEELHQILGFDHNRYPNVQILHSGIITKYKRRYKTAKLEVVETLNKTFLTQNNGGWADNKCQIDWFNLIYIYTDIVRESYCGNVKANILKIITRETGYHKELINYNFPNLLFVPLRVSEIRSIKIKCCDSFGQIPTYTEGMVSMTLFLRPRRNGF